MQRAQLRELGFTPRAIETRCANGFLFPQHRGVYSVGRPASTPLEHASAAVLACGPMAALSHGCGLTLWGLAKSWPDTPHVTVPKQRKRPGITVHIVPLRRTDIRTHHGIRVTSPARTLLDCAPTLTATALGRAVADARRAGLAHESSLIDVVTRFPRHPGAAILTALITDTNPTRSVFEDDFTQACRRFDLPQPEINTVLFGYEVDALFREHRLIVELDGWDTHRDRVTFESDRERDATMLDHGHATLRITRGRYDADPEREARRLQRILSARRA